MRHKRIGGQRGAPLGVGAARAPLPGLAFTLIELLVVIAVIAILASLLLPTLNRAKVAGRITYCKNNLHQWGIALSAYTTDFNVYPIYGGSIDRGPAVIYATFTWFGLMQPYTRANWTNTFISGGRSGPKQPQPPGIHLCPDYVRLGGWFLVGGGFAETDYGTSFGSYGYNAEGYSINESLGLGWEAPPTNPTITQPVREGEVVCPSDMIAIGDAMLLPTAPGQAPSPGVSGFDELNAMAGNGQAFLTELGLFPRAGLMDYQTQRHGVRWNVLYCDGHVLGESTKQFLDPRSDAVLRSWYRDHVPHVDIFTAQWRH
jgi:prepilin-type N-terminal cleavage/methylation domain-containing protein/prepilin-type processing-associated H-X9-DG protein